jgi:hypothetical protein
MQSLQLTNNTVLALSLEELLDIFKREVRPCQFLIKHPEMIGMVEEDGAIVFNNRRFFYDLNVSLEGYTEINKAEFFCSFFLNKPINDCIEILELLMDDEKWETIDKVISSLSSERLDVLKEFSKFPRLKNASLTQVAKMIITFPKIDWIKALWDQKFYYDGYTPIDHSYMAHPNDNELKKPLHVYSHLKGKHSKDAEKDLRQLFGGIQTIFNNTIFRKLPNDLKKPIIKDVFLSAYPIIASAPEMYSMFDNYCIQTEKNMNLKITRLAFRAYRHNNGLWGKKYKKNQIKDVTEMFLECLTEKSVTFDTFVWRAFIDIIGEKQNVSKPQLTMSDIKKAISIAQYY